MNAIGRWCAEWWPYYLAFAGVVIAFILFGLACRNWWDGLDEEEKTNRG